jgi:DNA-binding XRE family transcriptional regulator
MKNRITQLINSEGLTSSKFADTIGVQRSSISHILSGRNNPSLDLIQKIIANFPQINVDWLVSGKGEMYRNQENASLFDLTEEENQVDESPVIQPAQPPKLKKETVKSSADQHIDMNVFKGNKRIEKVVVFYTDKTFSEFNPA